MGLFRFQTKMGLGAVFAKGNGLPHRQSARHNAPFSASGKFRQCLGFSSPHKGRSPLRGPQPVPSLSFFPDPLGIVTSSNSGLASCYVGTGLLDGP